MFQDCQKQGCDRKLETHLPLSNSSSDCVPNTVRGLIYFDCQTIFTNESLSRSLFRSVTLFGNNPNPAATSKKDQHYQGHNPTKCVVELLFDPPGAQDRIELIAVAMYTNRHHLGYQ